MTSNWTRQPRPETATDPVLADDRGDRRRNPDTRCAGKQPDDFVFLQPGGRPSCQDRLDERFKKVRDLADLAKVRDTITIYLFPHRWISEAIEADMPIATIAEMAGTSIKQIEATYGHIRSTNCEDALKRLEDYRQQRAG